MEKQEEMRKRSQKLRRNMTKEESKLWYQFLRKYPLQFKRQYQIGIYIVDFYCYKAKLIVELDGSQHYNPEGQEYDRKRTEVLENQGFQVLRFSNLEVLRQFPEVCQQIDRVAVERFRSLKG